jgi:hypothetical protein
MRAPPAAGLTLPRRLLSLEASRVGALTLRLWGELYSSCPTEAQYSEPAMADHRHAIPAASTNPSRAPVRLFRCARDLND